MARPPKPSVRYYLPRERSKDSNGHIKLRGVASYNRKRLSFYINIEPHEVGFLFTVIAPDGSFNSARFLSKEEERDAKHLSTFLTEERAFVLKLIERAVEDGVWEAMTSEDLKNFFGFEAVIGEKEVFKRNGIFDKWASARKEGAGDERE